MQPFLGMLMAVSFDFPPKNWATCDGQILPINVNPALFSLLGTTFGGNGSTTFALPDLRGRIGIGAGQGPGLTGYLLGQRGGQESVTLNINEVPSHQHPINASTDAASGGTGQVSPAGNALGQDPMYTQTQSPNTLMSGSAIGLNAGGQPHQNRMPYTCINWVIALQGIFPSRN